MFNSATMLYGVAMSGVDIYLAYPLMSIGATYCTVYCTRTSVAFIQDRPLGYFVLCIFL